MCTAVQNEKIVSGETYGKTVKHMGKSEKMYFSSASHSLHNVDRPPDKIVLKIYLQ